MRGILKLDNGVESRQRRSVERFNDPMYPTQWYLKGKMNIEAAWDAGYNGKDIVVSVVDTGLQTDHDEIKNNYDRRASYNFVKNITDPKPTMDTSSHGTKVAGIIAGEVNNSKCGVGIAYKASLGGIKFIETSGESLSIGKDFAQASALSFSREYVDIYACAWGPDGKPGASVGYNKVPKVLEAGTKYGRGGKGNIFVFASGNDGGFYDSCTYDGYVTSIHTIAVSAVNLDGSFSLNMEKCPSIMAVTYARDPRLGFDSTEMPMATAAEENSCYNKFSGTSAAASVASGIIALVLQANRKLTWRDVQHIITKTANHNPGVLQDKENKTIRNAANFTVNNQFGFGLLDTIAMIKVAKKWINVPQQMSCSHEAFKHRKIPSQEPLVNRIQFDAFKNCRLEKLEHVVLTLNVTFYKRRDLQVELISPQGTKSYMIMQRQYDKQNKTDSDISIKMFPTMTLHNWGEDPRGDWTVVFRNSRNTSSSGQLSYYKLELYGTGKAVNSKGISLTYAWTLLFLSWLAMVTLVV